MAARGGRGGSSSWTSSVTRPTVASASRTRKAAPVMTSSTAGGREGGRDGVGCGLPPQSPRRGSSPSTRLVRAHDRDKSSSSTISRPRTAPASTAVKNTSAIESPPASPRSPMAAASSAASSAASAFPSYCAASPPLPPPSHSSPIRLPERTLHPSRLASSGSSSTARPSSTSAFGSSWVSSKRPTRTALSSSFPPSTSCPPSEVDLLLLEKKRLHAYLRQFERAFQKEHGRRVHTAGDILPVDVEYKRYKRVKAQLTKLGWVGKKEKGADDNR